MRPQKWIKIWNGGDPATTAMKKKKKKEKKRDHQLKMKMIEWLKGGDMIGGNLINIFIIFIRVIYEKWTKNKKKWKEKCLINYSVW